MAWGVLSTLPDGSTDVAIQEFLKFGSLVFLILNLVRTPEKHQSLITSLLWLTCYLALYSIYLYFTGQELLGGVGGVDRSKATGIFGDPNDTAATINAGSALALTRIGRRARWQQAVYAMISVVLLSLITVGGASLLVTHRHEGLALMLAALVGATFLVAAPDRMTNFDNTEEPRNAVLVLGQWSRVAESVPLDGSGVGDLSGTQRNDDGPQLICALLCGNRAAGLLLLDRLVVLLLQSGRLGSWRCFRNGTGSHRPSGLSPESAGYLVAAFFISRTYDPIPIMQVIFCKKGRVMLSSRIANRAR